MAGHHRHLYHCPQLYASGGQPHPVGGQKSRPGEDPTYGEIDGAWLSDGPYCTIHRVASRGEAHGLTGEIFHWCMDRCGHLRIDTHADNKPMQRAIEKFGFVYCGIIKAHDGTPRIAFEKMEQAKIKQP